MDRFGIDATRLRPEESWTIPGPAGPLEARWRPLGPDRQARGAVVVAHPLPTQGGSLLNKVVFHLARVLHHEFDLASLRFNFRGTGKSAGRFDGGRGETEDLLAAWAAARERSGGGLLLGAGFSFGAAVTLLAAVRTGREATPPPDALAVVGLPLLRFPLPEPFPSPLPLVAVHGGKDAFTPPEAVGKYLESWPGVHAFRVEPGADHFLEGSLADGLEFITRTLREWL